MRFDRWKTLWSITMLSFFGGAVVLVFAGDQADSSTAVEKTEAVAHEAAVSEVVPAAPEVTTGACLTDTATLQDIRRNKDALEARQRELTAKESELKAREQALNEEMKKLAVAREEIASINESRKKESDEKIAKLVETVENMNPKAAALLVAALDESLAVATMARLSTPKLAKLLNVMEPARSTKLSELLAGVVRVKSKPVSIRREQGLPADMAVTTSNPGKRGDQYDGKNNEQASNRTVNDGGESQSRRQPASSGAQQKGQGAK